MYLICILKKAVLKEKPEKVKFVEIRHVQKNENTQNVVENNYILFYFVSWSPLYNSNLHKNVYGY